jgi:hypothetical protein
LSQQAGPNNNQDEHTDTDSENKGSVIVDSEIHMAAIYGKYGTNHEFDRFNPVFPHPTNISKYLPLTSGNVQKWGDALVRQFCD